MFGISKSFAWNANVEIGKFRVPCHHVVELRFPYVVSGPSFCYFPLDQWRGQPLETEPIGNDDAGHAKLASFFLRKDIFVFWCLLHDSKEVPSGKLT